MRIKSRNLCLLTTGHQSSDQTGAISSGCQELRGGLNFFLTTSVFEYRERADHGEMVRPLLSFKPTGTGI
jgi:hypothetical protein